jgi:hypothetical protein
MSRITVVTGDRTGLIAEVAQWLGVQGINIASMDGRVVGTDAVLHVEVDDLPAALAVLTKAGLQVVSNDVVLFQVEDAPGSLARAARQLAEDRLDIRTMQTLSRSAGSCVVAIATDDNDRARVLLGDRLL